MTRPRLRPAPRREASADGSARTLQLSVEDAVTFTEGRRVRNVQEAPRWVDGYCVPGQFVAIRYCKENGAAGSSSRSSSCAEGALAEAARLFALASSPYEARRDSANLNASIVEVCGGEGGGGGLGVAGVESARCLGCLWLPSGLEAPPGSGGASIRESCRWEGCPGLRAYLWCRLTCCRG